MIPTKTLLHITQTLPRCSIGQSAGELIICDAHSEVLGKIDFETPGLIVYQGYTYRDKVIRRLKDAEIPFQLKEADMQEAMKILYDS